MHNSEHLARPKYRPDIDGLRAIAILSVVGFHAFPHWLVGGFIGVDIFFVISGFLISTIIIGGLELNSFSFVEFYIRRIKRIFPALLLVLITSFVFGWFALLADEYKQLGKHIAGGAGFISNLLLWNESGYFDNLAETKPLLHLWSLGVEEQFYIIWPLLLWLAWKLRLNLLAISIAVGVISFVLNVDKVRADTIAAFYSPQTRFWELMAGSVLSYMTLHTQNKFSTFKCWFDRWLQNALSTSAEINGKLWRNLQSLLGAALIAVGVLIISKNSYFPGWWAVLPTLGAVLIISGGAQAWLNRVVLSSRVLVWFGLISFPLYLWHWPLLSFVRIVENETPSLEIRGAVVVISIALAWLTYRLIETPVRSGKRSNAKTITLIVFMIVVGCVGYNCYDQAGLKFRGNIERMNKVNAEFVGPLWKYARNDTCLNKYPFDTRGYGWWFCMASKNENPTLLLLGNSYANHLYAGFSKNINFNYHSILSIGTCDPGWVGKAELTAEANNNPCSGYRRLDQQQLIDDIVEKSGSIRFAIIDVSDITDVDSNATGEYISSIKKRIDFLERNNIKAIIFLPHIHPEYDIRGCFDRPFKKAQMSCEMEHQDYETFSNLSELLVHELSKTNPNVIFFNPNELYCDANKCSFILNGMPVFRDQYHHFSEYASIELANYFEKWARINAPDILKQQTADFDSR